jgi:hypothetical protein
MDFDETAINFKIPFKYLWTKCITPSWITVMHLSHKYIVLYQDIHRGEETITKPEVLNTIDILCDVFLSDNDCHKLTYIL